jgi:Ca2+-binding EF-hand superfamily protein
MARMSLQRSYNVRIPENHDLNIELKQKVTRVIEGTDEAILETNQQHSAVRRLFEKYDLNGDGTIDLPEVCDMTKVLTNVAETHDRRSKKRRKKIWEYNIF